MKNRICIIEYGTGNFKSIFNALKYLGHDVIISNEIKQINLSDKIILPGVGSFDYAMNNLHKYGLVDILNNIKNKPILGICLGMQLLFKSSEEGKFVEGLKILKGDVKKIPVVYNDKSLKTPHIGWKNLEENFNTSYKFFFDIHQEKLFYFVHSYYVSNFDNDDIVAYCNYNNLYIPSIVNRGNIFATQFHPEKSGETGLHFIDCFSKL